MPGYDCIFDSYWAYQLNSQVWYHITYFQGSLIAEHKGEDIVDDKNYLIEYEIKFTW